MKQTIKISQTIIDRLGRTPNSCDGNLYGISHQNDLFILVLQADSENEIDFSSFLPTGIELCGRFQKAEITDLNIQIPAQSVLVTSSIGKENNVNLYQEQNGKLNKSEYQIITEQEINSTFLFIRLKGEVVLKSEFTVQALKDAFQIIKKSLPLDSVFGLLKSNLFLQEHGTINAESNSAINEFYEDVNGANDEGSRKKNKVVSIKPRVLDFNYLQQLTRDKSIDSIKEHAPIGILNKNPLTIIDTLLPLNCISMVHEQTKTSQLYEILLKSTANRLSLLEEKIIQFVKSNRKSLTFQPYHYYPEECKHFLTLLYAKSQTDKDTESERKLIHKQLLLDLNTPRFRRANQYSFDKKLNGPLINPHEGVKNTDNGGTIALVKGKYEYYHYCQNNMDDNGWGCAYRSLQTLASWFKLQGYVDRDVPTYQEIQQCLVDIRDKPSSFVGSRQWIGSTEVNFVLNTLLGVQNKIVYVSNGEDMASQGPELLNHFQNYGSPIMIGGGVLAHTILGVDYNQQTGDIRFLILDPHYTAGEDLHVIQNKGWCGWKNLSFWNKTAYYNMCLPLVPREV
ncbi:ufm1-specific protease 2 [Diabrotica virgifera virgifera]|uniref:Ufm1-specific protease 2 n=1 Tax=Diabrotica virgifera virgifera TaxID=50390 RepID=A0ABM5KLI1_DIAVI|nr:ufm1-specific protease 2 [Diabrotica virgifera virgifera]